MIKQKVYLPAKNLDQLINQIICACIVTLDWYLFQLIVLFKPDFNSCNIFALTLVDKCTTGTLRFVSVIANFVAPVGD